MLHRSVSRCQKVAPSVGFVLAALACPLENANGQSEAGTLDKTSSVLPYNQDPSRDPYLAGVAEVSFLGKDNQIERRVRVFSAQGDKLIPLQRFVHEPIGATIGIENLSEIQREVVNPQDPSVRAIRSFISFDHRILLSSQSFRETCCAREIISSTGLEGSSFRVDAMNLRELIVVYSLGGKVVGMTELPLQALVNSPDAITIKGVELPGTLEDYGPNLRENLSIALIWDTATCRSLRAHTVYNLRASVIENVLSSYESSLGKRVENWEALSIEQRQRLVSDIQRQIEVVTRVSVPEQYVGEAFLATRDLEQMISTFIADRNRIIDAKLAGTNTAVEATGAGRAAATKDETTDSTSKSEKKEERSEEENSKIQQKTKERSVSGSAGASFMGIGASVSTSNTSRSMTQTGHRTLRGTASSNVRTDGVVVTLGVMRGRDLVFGADVGNTGNSALFGCFIKDFAIQDSALSRQAGGFSRLDFESGDVQSLDEIYDRYDELRLLVEQHREGVVPKLKHLNKVRLNLEQLKAALEGRDFEPSNISEDPAQDILLIQPGSAIPTRFVERYFEDLGNTITSVYLPHEVKYLEDLLKRVAEVAAAPDGVPESVRHAVKEIMADAVAKLSEIPETSEGIQVQLRVRAALQAMLQRG